MDLIICDSARRRFEGVILAAGKERLRVALRGAADVTELTKEYDHWTLETGEPVDVEMLLADGTVDLIRFCDEVFPKNLSAGRSLM